MQEERIRRTGTNSVNSVDKNQFVDLELKQHTKVFPFSNVTDTIDQRLQFAEEREKCTKYRLILTINPYCSNILFNAVTEIVQNEGTNKDGDLKIANSTEKLTVTSLGGYDVKGKQEGLTNTDMVRNTEYSNGTTPFVYHCGYDIFNNHILRNQTFKLVNTYNNTPKRGANKNDSNSEENYYKPDENVFNTIEDYMRYADGTNVELKNRTNVKTLGNKPQRHLYMRDEVLTFIDSINANLSEQNGWWGFNNRSSIQSTEYREQRWQDMKIAKVFNDENSLACGFIEMYPDSTLYSFSPKYNKFQNREEHNWDICITYPYENDYGYTIDDTNDENNINIQDVTVTRCLINGIKKDSTNKSYANKKELENDLDNIIVNGLLLASHTLTIGTSGQDIILFKSYVKHNLKRGDKIKLFYSYLNRGDERIDANQEKTYIEIQNKTFEVVNVGDLNDENQDYYFYINDVNDILNELQADTLTQEYKFRFVKVSNGRDCKYYYRKFKKLPNFRIKKQELTDKIVEDKQQFEDYIVNNCSQNNKMLLFNREQYPLAFSKTIYGDDKTQIVFTDSIDIDKLKDNLGRPLTELYMTFIKRNKGHELWYKKNKTGILKDIEFSHCFGKVISGLNIYGSKTDKDNSQINNNRIVLGDSQCLNNSKSNFALDDDIDIDTTDTFYGDVVELNQYTMTETVLSDVYFRFNTEQREHKEWKADELNCGKFIYNEIEADDYDAPLVSGQPSFSVLFQNADALKENETPTTYRPEGYHYKAHYQIKVREFGPLRQGSHKAINVSSCGLKQANGLFIEVVSTLRSGVTSGSVVYLYNNETNERIGELTVNSVQSTIRFLLNPMDKQVNEDKGYDYLSIYDIASGLLYSNKTLQEGDTWINEYGEECFATEEIKDGTETVVASNIGQTVQDYGNPKYILRLKNIDIPDYAYEVGKSNIYLWRDVLNVGNEDAVELKEYPFCNGHFYISQDINFFLKRQDPFGLNGLYDTNKIPNDIYGNVKEENIYEYKDGTNIIC